MGTHWMYAAVFEAAFAAKKASRAKVSSTGSTLGQLKDLSEQSHDREFLQDTRWSEVRSKRAVKSVAFFGKSAKRHRPMVAVVSVGAGENPHASVVSMLQTRFFLRIPGGGAQACFVYVRE